MFNRKPKHEPEFGGVLLAGLRITVELIDHDGQVLAVAQEARKDPLVTNHGLVLLASSIARRAVAPGGPISEGMILYNTRRTLAEMELLDRGEQLPTHPYNGEIWTPPDVARKQADERKRKEQDAPADNLARS